MTKFLLTPKEIELVVTALELLADLEGEKIDSKLSEDDWRVLDNLTKEIGSYYPKKRY